MKRPEYIAVRSMGRCANGNEADGGVRYHALRKDRLSDRAVCGFMPGYRSAGWADYPDAVRAVDAVSCPRCRLAMRKFGWIKTTEPRP